MPWHDKNPWRKRHDKPKTVEQMLDDIERKCRAGDLSLRGAIDAARKVGLLEQAGQKPAATSKE